MQDQQQGTGNYNWPNTLQAMVKRPYSQTTLVFILYQGKPKYIFPEISLCDVISELSA